MAKFTLQHAQTKPDTAALIDERGSSTWADLNTRVNQVIAGIRAQGLQAGDSIAIFAGNCREYFELILAANHIGVVYVPVNWHFTADELAYVVNDAGCKMLFIEDPYASRLDELNEELAGIPAVVIRSSAAATNHTSYAAWADGFAADEPADESMGGPMFYTSGTTGRPKGVRSTTAVGSTPLAVLEMMAGGMSGMLSIPNDGTTLLCGPVYHSAQWAFSVFPLLAGSTVVMRHKFDAAETLEIIDQHKVTNVHLVPTQFTRLLRVDEPKRQAFKGEDLQIVWHGAAPCPPAIKQGMIDWWGPVVNEYYGSTEGSIVTTATAQDWMDRPGTVGVASAMVEISIIGDDGSTLPTGESGEIYVRNLTGSDFEYHNEPEKTAAVHKEPGMFTFGDIGYFDKDGYLYLSDRKIDMIISGGVNIYPAEIEGVLATHPAVQDVAVFGIPNDEFGEEVKAAVELVPGQKAGPELDAQLDEYCRAQLAGYKAPRSYDMVAEMPRHETGKLYKRLLRDAYWKDSGRSI